MSSIIIDSSKIVHLRLTADLIKRFTNRITVVNST